MKIYLVNVGTLFLVLSPAISTEECKFFLYLPENFSNRFKFFYHFFFNSKFVIEGHGFEFEKLSHRLKHAIIMSLFLFHVCHEGSDGYKKWTLSFVSFYGIWKKQALPKKIFIDIFSALPAVYFYAPCRYIKAQSKYLKKRKKRERLFLWMNQKLLH